MRILTLNLNGLRSATSKGLVDWVAAHQADVYAFQELKLHAEIAPEHLAAFPGYRHYYHCAEQKGYSGVGFLTREEPIAVTCGTGDTEFDREGRVLRLDFPSLSILNIYLPSGTTGEPRQAVKERFLAHLLDYLPPVLEAHPKLVIVGDFNIAHTEHDIHHPTRAHKLSGFLPHERAWFSELLALGLVDTLRHIHPDGKLYTWFSFRSGARAKNLGWRLDYQLASTALVPQLIGAHVHSEAAFSDHLPVELSLTV
jgi:exodeoxyribonuclease III